MKIVIVILIVSAFGYIQINGEGVSECYLCNKIVDESGCDNTEIQKCPIEEDNICLSGKFITPGGVYLYRKQCFSNTPDVTEWCAIVNQTGGETFCYICNEDLCNLQ